ncbi:MAG: hypothetical protein CMP69_04020 [Flavobacteriales bacterium]|nr:hypothetical protein [Flavobacteriales bacterium]|tara:strand:- start:7627 stop:8823 length:1197 start_codon:yes stop_codon:yes gene_type:complete
MRKYLFVLLLFIGYKSYSQSGTGADIDGSSLTGSDRLNTITTAMPFLLISPDSRSGSMGDVGVATSPDANSLHWNPAKFAFVEDNMGFSVSYVPWLRALVPDINLSYLSGYRRINDKETIGLELRYFSLGDITFTDINGTELGQYKPNEFAIGTAYARKLADKFSLAISARYIYSDLTGGQAAGGIPTKPGISIASDISGYYSTNINIARTPFDMAVGCNISNIGNKVSYTETSVRDFIPINLRIGTSLGTEFDDYNNITIAFDINKLLVPTPPTNYDPNNETWSAGMNPDVSVVSGIFQSFWDAPGGVKEEFNELNYSFGTEYWYANQFAIRAGYFNEHDTKGGRKFFTFGSGVKYNVFALDFSYLVNASRSINGSNPLANTMRFTLIFDFGELQGS